MDEKTKNEIIDYIKNAKHDTPILISYDGLTLINGRACDLVLLWNYLTKRLYYCNTPNNRSIIDEVYNSIKESVKE